MKRTVTVCLGNDAHVVGNLRYDQQGNRESIAFSYDPTWLVRDGSHAIDPALPLVGGFQFHKKTRHGSLFHGAIADTEPDGWGRKVILRDHAKRRESQRETCHVTPAPLTELDFLLAVDDYSRLGALRFRDEDGIFQASPIDGQRRTPPLIDIRHVLRASHAVEKHQETAADLAYLCGRGTSLGGLRPKCTFIDEDGQLAIGKFPSVTDQRAVTKGEVLALRLAALAGLRVAKARLLDVDGSPVALIRRFDRGPGGQRIPYCSAATMLGVERDDGTQSTYTHIVDTLRVHGSQPHIDCEELWCRIAYSLFINNVDDHLHNHGFLYDVDGKWRLSPAFDVNPFPDRERELKTWISEETGAETTIAALLSVAPYFRLSPSRCETLLARIAAAVQQWRQVGSELGMTRPELEDFAEAFIPPL